MAGKNFEGIMAENFVNLVKDYLYKIPPATLGRTASVQRDDKKSRLAQPSGNPSCRRQSDTPPPPRLEFVCLLCVSVALAPLRPWDWLALVQVDGGASPYFSGVEVPVSALPARLPLVLSLVGLCRSLPGFGL